ncbi:MAG: nucleotide sugar dehydrogenase [Acidobacteriota bacterium]|nr:nucleotide sugar dehydrogenase [Blastocatellia bacterium]MDW8239304.1 nucleotide sugar dehydrogenase [Acidobacteriota bacterium]
MNTVAVIGLGYVGLPLALAFAEERLQTYGLDVDAERVESLRRGVSYIGDVSDEELRRVRSHFTPTTDSTILGQVDAAIICVPTPLRKTRDPDISYVITAAEEVAKHLHPGMLVVLESTTYPGTTEEALKPLLEATGLKVGKDFFLAFSPERIDPANKQFTVRNTPKVVGGVTPACTERAVSLYRRVVNQVVPVASATTAELTKLLENTFRVINIGLVNEMAMLCHRMGVDVWEVVEAAATKPFGFMPFYPGPGIGGHCIPVDPLYLSWRAKGYNFTTRFIELADEVNRRMPEYVVTLIADALNNVGKPIRGSRILLLGMAYKKDVSDVRESPALEVLELLSRRGARLSYHDPFVPQLVQQGRPLRSVALTEAVLAESDCAVVLTDHSAYDWPWIVNHSNLVVDTRNATKALGAHPKIYRL